MITNNTESRQSKYDAIIILGNSPNWNDKPNPFLKSRLDTGIDLLLQGKSDNIILTGTKKESNLSEAEIMNNYCLERGVPNRKILLEKSAKSTKENLLNCRKLMNAKNLKNALVITSGHHTSRTVKYYSILKIDTFEVIAGKSNLWSFLGVIPLTIIKIRKIASI